MPFAVAIALERGNVTLQDYIPETLREDRLRRLAGKVSIRIDEEMDRIYPEERGCRMKIELFDGRTSERAIPVAKGEPENPVTDKDLKEKLSAMLEPYYSPSFFEGLWEISVEKKISDTTYRDIVDHFGRFHKK
jgi:2-methylcitrate dehydratase PrpD